jgi:hypothetical protein
MEHIDRNLSKAVKITAVSSASEPNGYIEFEDNSGTNYRYDVSDGYVRFGQVGDLSELAGPVSKLVFTCYSANDFNTPAADVNSIRMVKIRMTLADSHSSGQGKTITTSVYLRTNSYAPYRSLIVYSEETRSLPRCRTRGPSDSAWSSQSSANNIGGYGRWVVAARCPIRTETAVCLSDNDSDLNIQFLKEAGWSAVTELTNDVGTVANRPFYIAYEQLSGDLLMAYRKGNSNLLYYRIYNGTAISGESTLSLLGTGNPVSVRLVSKPASDEILLVVLDSKKYVTASVWNGSGWGNTILLENQTETSTDEGIWAAYEGISGRAMVVWSASGTNTFQYRRWNGSAWSSEASGPSFSRTPVWLKLAANPSSNEMILGSISNLCVLKLTVWNGSSWGSPLVVDTKGAASDRRSFDIAYENGSNRALAVWGRMASTDCFYRVWDGSSWSSEQTNPGHKSDSEVIQLVPGPAKNQIFVTVLTWSENIESMLWDGSTLSSPVTIVNDAGGSSSVESFMVVAGGGGQAIMP